MSTTATKEAQPALGLKTAVAPEGLKVSDQIIALSQMVKAEFKIGEGGVVEVPKDLYETTLPVGMTMADVRKVQDHNNNLVAAVGLALGDTGLDYFKKHKNADQLSVEFAAGKDKVGLLFQRNKPVPDGSGGQKDKYGVLSARWQVSGAGNRGAFKKVRENLAERAAAALNT